MNNEVVNKSNNSEHKVDKEDTPSKKSAIDTQVGGDHYLMPIQVYDFINANKDHMDGLKANVLKDVMKYIIRHDNKGGEEDLDKASNLIEMYREYEYE